MHLTLAIKLLPYGDVVVEIHYIKLSDIDIVDIDKNGNWEPHVEKKSISHRTSELLFSDWGRGLIFFDFVFTFLVSFSVMIEISVPIGSIGS